jgi:hypothetical protein
MTTAATRLRHLDLGTSRCVKLVLFSLALIECAADPRVSNAEQSEVAEAVAGYESYLRGIRSASFSSVFKDKFASSDTYTNSLAQEWVIDFEGRRLWRRTQRASLDGSALADLSVSETLTSPTRRYEVSLQSGTGRVRSMTAHRSIPKNYWATETGFLYLCYPFGYLEDDSLKFIPDLLVNPSVTTKQGKVVLTGGVPGDYRITVELSKSKGWMPLRVDWVRLERQGKHELVASSYVIDESRQVDGIWFPVDYHCTAEHSAGARQLPPGIRVENGITTLQLNEDGSPFGNHYEQCSEMSLVAEVAITNVEFNRATENDLELRADIPNGTKVWMQDDLNQEYVWENGQAMPRNAKAPRVP